MATDQAATPIMEAYKHCPKCAGNFENKGGNWLKCTQCQYNFFVNMAPTAGVIILDDQNRVLLAKRKFEPKKGTWQSPGGFLQLNERYEDALLREAGEELGVKVEAGEFLGSFPESYEYGGVILPFLAMYSAATIVEGEITEKDDVEEARFFAIDELDDLDITYRNLRPLIKRYIEKQTSRKLTKDKTPLNKWPKLTTDPQRGLK